MSGKITIEIENIMKESIALVKALDIEGSISAYFYLKQISSNEVSRVNSNFFNYDKEKEAYRSKEKNIVEEYRIYLKSHNKSNSTIKDYINESTKFNQYFTKEKISIPDLNIAVVDNYLSFKNSRNISSNTYIKLINCIRSFLKFLFSREYLNKDLASFVKIPSKVESMKEVLSDLDIKKVEKYLQDRKEKYKNENLRDNIIFYLGIDCGFRRQEIINLNWEDIEFNEGLLSIKKSKGGKNRTVYFNPTLKEYLFSYRKATGKYNGAVVRGVRGKRITKCSLQDMVSRIFKESKTYRKNLTIHSLRHTYAERLRRKGTDINTISKLMGHSSIETTAIYLHSNKEDFKKAVL